MGDAQTVTVAGHRLRVAVAGEGQPLLLVNGLAGSVRTWDSVLPELSGFRCIAFDAPGAGGSPPAPLPLRPRDIARLAVGLLDRLGIPRADVLGLSLGGAAAQEMAYRHPHRVRRLVLVSTSCGIGGAPPRLLALSLLISPVRFLDPRIYALVAPSMLGGRMRTDPGFRRQYVLTRHAHPPSLHGYLLQMLGVTGWSSITWLHRIPQPTLVLAGDDDPLVPATNARLLTRRIPHARLDLRPGMGHLLLLSDPQAAGRAVREFLHSAASP